jgi:hypothetical protein
MKSTFKIVLLASLVVFAAACGKKNSSGGNSYGSLVSNNSQLTSSSLDAVGKFNQWYKSNTEGGSPGMVGNYGLDYQSSSATVDGNCEERELFGFLPYWYCSSSGSNSNNGGSFDCRVTVSFSNQSLKLNNPTLKKIYEGKMGTLVNATQIGSLITLQFQKSNGFVVSYKIDTNYHSSFQPVEMTDSETGSVDRLVYYTTNPSLLTNLPICD